MRKIFSLLAAVLFAGSMMATTVTKTVAELATELSFENSAVCTPFALDEVITVSTEATDANTGKYYSSGEQIRLYQTGAAKLILTAADGYKISSVTLEYASQNTGILVEAASGEAVAFNNVQAATFTVGNSGSATNGQARITSFSVTYETAGETPVEPTPTELQAVSDSTTWDFSKITANTANALYGNDGIKLTDESTPSKNDEVIYADYSEDFMTFAEDFNKAAIAFKGEYPIRKNKYCQAGTLHFKADVAGTIEVKFSDTGSSASATAVKRYLVVNGEQTEYWTSRENNGETPYDAQLNMVSGKIAVPAGDVTITGSSAIVVYYVTFVPAQAVEPVLADPTNCAEAREAALSVEANNVPYKDSTIYSIQGYVTEIKTAYNDQYHNITFWMADAANGGQVLQAYRAACASADEAPIVGDKVTVTGALSKYNSTPQFMANSTFVIDEHATPVVPQNLGEKTIAEFLTLANTVDTCVITGVVANIKTNADGSYNKYGNFDLVDGDASVYVYGLLTAAGEAQKFQEMGVDAGDTLTVKAVYSLYNNAPQAKNAIFVEVKKYVEPVVFSHELYGSEALPSIGKTWFANTSWTEETNSHAEIVNDYDINLVLVDAKAGQWQSQVFVNPGFTWEVGAYYKMEFDLATNHQLGGVAVKVNNNDNNVFYYSYPNDNIFLANQTTHFVADSIYAMAEPTDGGQLIFSVGWCDANTEILISNIVITKYEAPVVAQDINITLSSITTPGSLIWTDATATSGWWQIMGGSDSYGFSLSNAGEIAEAAGTYTVADLDAKYSYISVYGENDTTDVAFVDGSVTVAIAEGVVTVNGTLVGDDGNNYIFNLTYKDPVAEKTVELNIPAAELYDGYAAYGLYGVYGYTADNTSYVQLGIWTDEFQGNFTEEDLDNQYIGSGVVDATGSQSIFSAAITVTPGNGEGVYRITADLLCYNNTLYKVTMQIGVEQGIEDVDVAVKAIKSIVNGQVVIEKAGKTYNMNGAVIR